MITKADIDNRVKWINRLLEKVNRSVEVDHYNPGGNPHQYKLFEWRNGAAYSLSSRLTKREFFYFLEGIITGLEVAK